MKILNFIFAFVVAFFICSAAGATILTPFIGAGLILAQFTPAGTAGVLFVNQFKFNIARPTDKNAGTGEQLYWKVYYAYEEQVDTDNFPTRNDNTNTISDTVPMNAGELWHYLSANPKKVNFTFASEGDAGTKKISPKIQMEFAGLNENLEVIINEYLNGYCYLILEECATGTKRLGGEKCSPMELVLEESGYTADKTGFMLTFQCSSPFLPARYTGAVVTAAATVVASNATSITAAGSGQYQLTDGTSSAKTITTFASAVDGEYYEILGSGGSYPSIITDANDFILKNGTQWTATTGAKLNVKAFKDGGATYKFIEQSRS